MKIKAAAAARLVGVQPQTIHKWVRQGWLTRHPNGYEVADVLAAERNRSTAALCVRAGIERAHWPDENAEPA